jgi:hypothetical protein
MKNDFENKIYHLQNELQEMEFRLGHYIEMYSKEKNDKENHVFAFKRIVQQYCVLCFHSQ